MLIHRKSSDSTLVYELAPRSKAYREGVLIEINSAGFRDNEFPENLPAGSRRIVVLGDSVAWGWGVPMDSAFPQVLERKLHEMPSTPPGSAVVFNLSVDGYSTKQELRLLETRGMSLQPDLVIISYVLNDPDIVDGGLDHYYAPRLELSMLVKRAWTSRYLRGYPDEYHHRIHARYKDQTVEQFRHLGEISRSHKLPILVAVTPVLRFDNTQPYPWQDLHAFIGGLCKDNGLSFLDLYASFEKLDQKEHYFDLWHPTVKGHAVIAQAIADYLKTMPPTERQR